MNTLGELLLLVFQFRYNFHKSGSLRLLTQWSNCKCLSEEKQFWRHTTKSCIYFFEARGFSLLSMQRFSCTGVVLFADSCIMLTLKPLVLRCACSCCIELLNSYHFWPGLLVIINFLNAVTYQWELSQSVTGSCHSVFQSPVWRVLFENIANLETAAFYFEYFSWMGTARSCLHCRHMHIHTYTHDTVLIILDVKYFKY